MSLFTERLRRHGVAGSLAVEAADRIEALEGALREIKDQHLSPDQSSAIAKAALAPEQDKSVNVFDLLARYPEQDK